MSYVTETLGNLLHQTAFFNLTWGNSVYDRCCLCIPISGNQEGFEPSAACSDLHSVCCL